MTENESNLIIPDELISQKIYIVRNCKVMLDRDLADLFDVRATRLREQVKRNRDKFPLHFMFQLSDFEVDIMVSQNAIPSRQHLGGSSKRIARIRASSLKVEALLRPAPQGGRGGRCSGGLPPRLLLGLCFSLLQSYACLF